MTDARHQLAEAVRKVVMETMERRPITARPPEGTVAIVDNGTVERWGSLRSAAKFKSRQWVRASGGMLPFEPTIWIAVRSAD